MPVITVRIKYHKVSITYSFRFCCGRRGSGLVMTSAWLCTEVLSQDLRRDEIRG